MSIQIRGETPTDIAAIEAVTASAFLHAPHTSHTEQFIVDALRKAGELALSLVAVDDDTVVGHIAASPVSISDGTDGWYGIGPVSVAPEWQGQAIGSQLLRRALAELQRMGAAGCVLVGDPRFYVRFGFKPEPALVLPDVPPEYFQAVSFCGFVPKGRVSFHEAFNAKS